MRRTVVRAQRTDGCGVMEMRLEKKKKLLLIWTGICILVMLAGIRKPVERLCSQGLEGANQANLRSRTEELTAGKTLEFVLEPPAATVQQIGFFFTANGHDFQEGSLRILVLDDQEVLIGGQEYALDGMTDQQFLSVPVSFAELDRIPEQLKVRIGTDVVKEGPSAWLNETTRTPGSASVDGVLLSKSLVYNLTYTIQVHSYQKPLFIGLILFLFGLGVYGAGGFAAVEKRTRRTKDRRFPMPSGREMIGLAAAVLAVAAVFLYLYDTQIRIAQNTTEKAAVIPADGETMPVNEENRLVSQTVRPGEDMLTGLGVRFYIDPEHEPGLTEGSMHASVTDLTLGQTVCETDIAAGQFISGEYVGLLFHDSQTGVMDHTYRIDLVFSPELWDSGLEIMTGEEGICVNAYLYFNIFLKRFFFFLFLGVEGFLCLFWYAVIVKRVRLEHVLFITLLFCGLVYNVLLAPQMVPDEAKHIDMAYRYSNELLGYESLGDTWCLMRAEDAQTEFTASPSFQNYRNIYYGLFSAVQDDTLVETKISSNIEGSFLLYAPSVLGMTLARILGWGTVPMLLFSRYLNLLLFALLAQAGMKRLPFGRMTLFVLALLPVNVQQCTSFSHDAVVHGILFFYCCLCLQAIYEETPMSGQRMMLLELMALFLVYCKNGSYLPLCFLPVLIPRTQYAGKREKYTATAALLGIPVLAFMMNHMQTVSKIVNTTEATSVVSTGGGSEYLTGYTIGYFLKEPMEFVYMIVNTVLDKTGFYLESLIGYKLGWVEIETSMAVVMLFWFLLFLSTCDSWGEIVKIGKFQRFWMGLLCMGCTGMILLGMLLQWTPFGHVSIEGVQGRYFLPFLLIFLTACKSSGILLERKIDRGIAVAAVSGQFVTLICIIRQITMV